VQDSIPIPWWRLATVVLLGIALGIAVANGRTWDAVIVAVLIIPALAMTAAAIYFRVRGRRE
jgi:hypothetical protein